MCGGGGGGGLCGCVCFLPETRVVNTDIGKLAKASANHLIVHSSKCPGSSRRV